ncbi:MAG: aspartate 1-decarboxylase [Thermotogota bacterium]|nr:aspartate 1-decarboxylase [Thermotogota bacterium]MDK2865114.1 aspartate 1-decarboxylase [Thermotogota bacterium]HCZ06767.1 aspartate 1-decarboxylase [Thermotogota bacterium]
MKRILLKSKLHMAVVNERELNYVGSISIDEELMELADLVEGEKVLVANVNTGERFETYVIPAPRGSRKIGLNGAAARLVEIGDRIIVMAFGIYDKDEKAEPRIVILNEHNEPVKG